MTHRTIREVSPLFQRFNENQLASGLVYAVLLVGLVTGSATAGIAGRGRDEVMVAPVKPFVSYIGLRFPNYGVDLTIPGSLDAGIAWTLAGHCLGFAEAVCDAWEFNLFIHDTPVNVVKYWIEIRQRDAKNLVSDILHNYIVDRNQYTSYNFNVICDWLRRRKPVPVVLLNDRTHQGHAVVVYAVTKSTKNGRYFLYYYDPNIPVVWEDNITNNYTQKILPADDEAYARGERETVNYVGPKIVLDPTASLLIGIGGTDYNRFFPIQKYEPRCPTNVGEWYVPQDED